MSKRQRARFHPRTVPTIVRARSVELVVNITRVSLVAGVAGQAEQLAIHAMLAHPSSVHIWTVLLIAVAGAFVYKVARVQFISAC